MKKLTHLLYRGNKGDAGSASVCVAMIWFFINILMAAVEYMLVGETFMHFGDVVLAVSMISYIVYIVFMFSKANAIEMERMVRMEPKLLELLARLKERGE